MDTNFRYKFDSSSKKFICPGCGQKRFVRFVDTLTGKYLDEQYGKCDRMDNCGYFMHPYGDPKFRKRQKTYRKTASKKIRQPVAYIPNSVLEKTLNLQYYGYNDFIQNLLSNMPFPFNPADIEKVIAQYYIGTVNLGAGKRPGAHKGYATTFPFIDEKDNIRAIQAKQFSSSNNTLGTPMLVTKLIENACRRAGKPLPEWLEQYNQNELKISCFFGAHLLHKYPRNPVALVEAPKTAVYGTLYFGSPNDETKPLWLAVYNKSCLTSDRCQILEGRKVMLFPDLSSTGNTFKEWSTKAADFEKQIRGTRFSVSDLLEKNASDNDRLYGLDLADYLIKQDWRLFR